MRGSVVRKEAIQLATGFLLFLFVGSAATARGLLNLERAAFFEFLFFALVPIGNGTEITGNA